MCGFRLLDLKWLLVAVVATRSCPTVHSPLGIWSPGKCAVHSVRTHTSTKRRRIAYPTIHRLYRIQLLRNVKPCVSQYPPKFIVPHTSNDFCYPQYRRNTTQKPPKQHPTTSEFVDWRPNSFNKWKQYVSKVFQPFKLACRTVPARFDLRKGWMVSWIVICLWPCWGFSGRL